MTSPFCLLPQYADRFIEKVKSGELAPDVLIGMTSAERHQAFAKIVGEANATHVNASFESRLLLKNQQQGITNWIKKAENIPPAVKRDLLARVERLDKVLSPVEQERFLADLAKQRLGFGVTMEEAGRITALAKNVSETKAALIAVGGDKAVPTDAAGLAAKDAYGRALVEFSNYTADLQNAVKKPRTLGNIVKQTAGFTKSINASFDNSALFNQGLKTLWSHPIVWAENAAKSFVDLVRTVGGKAVADEARANIVSRPNAINGFYRIAELATATTEEAFPESPIAKIPVLGRLYKASENAFTGFMHTTRADVFDNYIEIARGNGRDVRDPAFLKSLGKMVNSLTGRGDLGKANAIAEELNVAFFSPRRIKADIDFLTAHQFQKDVDPFVRKQAAINLAKYVLGTATVLITAKALNPDAVELDPRSTAAGTIKSGNTHFDITAGERTIAVLAARLAPLLAGQKPEVKSSVTGKVRELNTGKFGETTGLDLVEQYFKNKAAPLAQVALNRLQGHDFQGNEPTIARDLATLFAPLAAKNIAGLAQDPSTDAATGLAAAIADGLGIQTNTMTPKPKHKPKTH